MLIFQQVRATKLGYMHVLIKSFSIFHQSASQEKAKQTHLIIIGEYAGLLQTGG
jgi:hypothetical protein